MSAYIKYPEEIQKCIDIYDPYGSQIANGELDKLPQEVIDAYNKAKKMVLGTRTINNKST